MNLQKLHFLIALYSLKNCTLFILLDSVFVHICFKINQLWVSLEITKQRCSSDRGNIRRPTYQFTETVSFITRRSAK